MKIYDNGIYRNMTAREIEENNALVPQLESEITDTQRIDALETAILELAEVIFNG